MSKADEMFEKLGYIKEEMKNKWGRVWGLSYKCEKHYVEIEFDCQDEEICIATMDKDSEPVFIGMQELQAINAKIKELRMGGKIMREIKFRAWSEDEWIYGNLLKVDEWNQDEHEKFNYFIQTDILSQGEYEMYYITDDNTIGQYTGLKDKNGKEIYEGDYIEYKVDGEIIEKGIVKYSEKYAQYVLVGTGTVKDEFEPLGDYNMEVFEVMGNVWEDSDLLNDSKNTKSN